MKRTLHHPIWMHLPEAGMLGYALWRLSEAAPLPAQVPNKGETMPLAGWLGLMGLVMLMMLGLAYAMDEMWARDEDRKRFNWISLLGRVPLLLLLALVAAQADAFAIGGNDPRFSAMTWGALASAVALAVGLEMVRPHTPRVRSAVDPNLEEFEERLRRMREEGAQWVYFDVQNPWWMTLLLVVPALISVIGAAGAALDGELWVAALMVLVVALVVCLLGGQRSRVSPDGLEVRLGLLGIRLLRIRPEDVLSATVHDFMPLQEFGGWGIRMNARMRGYYWNGNRGVLLTLREAKPTLIGSDHPERLLSALRAAGLG